jgi:type IV pilus assembly protein PilW
MSSLHRIAVQSRMRGFSLVELMVAMAVSLVLLAGALSILFSSKVTYSENERLARIQEAGRTTMEIILRDIRAAGFAGCTRTDPLKYQNGLVGPTSMLWNFAQPLSGFEAGASAWTPTLDASITNATVGSDVIVVRTSRLGKPVFRTNAGTTPTGLISVDKAAAASVPVGTKMVIGDCEYASVFNVTAFTDSGATATIAHVLGAASGNNVTDSLTANFQIDSIVTPIETIVYYVAPVDPLVATSGPALWQTIGAGTSQMLVEGVENIQLRFGEDTNGDQRVDTYVTASGVANWANIISVSIAVLVRSPAETGLETDSRSYLLLGGNAVTGGKTLGPFNDRRQRSVFTTTVALRNTIS